MLGKLIRAIQEWWWARQRKIDMELLWPSIKKLCNGDLVAARAAFAVHAFNDPAWVRHYEESLYSFIDALE